MGAAFLMSFPYDRHGLEKDHRSDMHARISPWTSRVYGEGKTARADVVPTRTRVTFDLIGSLSVHVSFCDTELKLVR